MYGSGMGRAREGKIIKFLSLERLMAPHTHILFMALISPTKQCAEMEKLRHAVLCDLSGATPADPQPEIRCKGPLYLGGSLRLSTKSPTLSWDLPSKSA